jgi:hypothetical protein
MCAMEHMLAMVRKPDPVIAPLRVATCAPGTTGAAHKTRSSPAAESRETFRPIREARCPERAG